MKHRPVFRTHEGAPIELDAETIARAATELGLLGGQPIVDAIEEAEQGPEGDQPPPEGAESVFDPEHDAYLADEARRWARDQREAREFDEAQTMRTRIQKARIGSPWADASNADAYGPDARRIVDGQVTALAVDKKRSADRDFWGDTVANIAKGLPRQPGSRSSNGGRKTVDPKVLKLKKAHGRPTIDDEPRSVHVTSRVTQTHAQTLGAHDVTTSDALAFVAKALAIGALDAKKIEEVQERQQRAS